MPLPTPGGSPDTWGQELNDHITGIQDRIDPGTAGTNGQVLGRVGGAPAWVTPAAGGSSDAFTVTGDGTDQTAVLRTALESARDSTTVKTVRIIGTVLVAYTPLASVGTSPLLEAGCTLEGLGYSSCIKYIGSTITADGTWYGVRYRANAVVRNLRIDGSRGDVNKAARTNFAAFALAGSSTLGLSDNPVFSDMWIHDVPGKGTSEAFTILGGDGEQGAKVSDLYTWDNDGTGGYHPTGVPVGGTRGGRCEIANAYAWNCGWQGMSSYGADNIRYVNCHAWNNAFNGFNNEWGSQIDYVGAVSHTNGKGNFGTYGDVDIRYWDPVAYDANAALATDGGEFRFFTGSYGGNRSVGGTIEIYGGSVTPRAGSRHIFYSHDDAVTMGQSFPDIRIHHPEAHSWTIRPTEGFARPGIQYIGQPVGRIVTPGPLVSWPTSGGTVTAYAGGGNEGPNPVTYAATAQFNSLRTPFMLAANRRYLVRMRLRLTYAARDWTVDFNNAGGTGVATAFLLDTIPAVDAGVWITAHVIVNVSSAGPARFRIMNSYAGANEMVVDYVDILELTTIGGSEPAPYEAAWDRVGPLLGGYYLWVDASGRLRIANARPTSDTSGTIVGTQV